MLRFSFNFADDSSKLETADAGTEKLCAGLEVHYLFLVCDKYYVPVPREQVLQFCYRMYAYSANICSGYAVNIFKAKTTHCLAKFYSFIC